MKKLDQKRVNINIPLSRYQDLLSWDQPTIDRLVEAAVQMVVQIGLRIDNDSDGVYLKEAESKGARIDRANGAVMFTEEDVRQTIEVMRKTSPVPQPYQDMCSSTGREEKFMPGNGANLLFDWDQWTVKAPSVSDIVELCQWAQGYDDVGSLFPPVMLKDVDQKLAPVYNYALMCKYCRKTVYHEQPTEPLHVRYLEKMARVVEKSRGYYQPMQAMEYVNPPFRMGRRGIATMLERVDSGACDRMGIGPMSIGGMSAPITVSGVAVVALAEVLAGLTFFRVLRPGYGLMAMLCVGNLDLRTARVSFFGMHTHLCNIAAWELIVRGLGVNTAFNTWYREANEPGMQALYEFGMAQSLFSSLYVRCAAEIGGLCNGNVFSPHQAVLDIEAMKEFNELLYGFDVSEEAFGLDEIVNARFEQGLHMGTEHTVKYMKDGIPFSDFYPRGLSAGAQHDKGHTQTDELMEKAETQVRNAIEKGRQSEPDTELGNELYEYVKEAAAELGIEAPALA